MFAVFIDVLGTLLSYCYSGFSVGIIKVVLYINSSHPLAPEKLY
jgi:hypothetical protein